jgi:hypothetical protein
LCFQTVAGSPGFASRISQTRSLHGDGTTLTGLAGVAVQLGQPKDVLCDLEDVAVAVLDGDGQKNQNLEPIVGSNPRLEPVRIQQTVPRRSLLEQAALNRMLAALAGLGMLVVPVPASRCRQSRSACGLSMRAVALAAPARQRPLPRRRRRPRQALAFSV